MTDKRIKSYLEDRLKRLESIKNEREWTTSELGDIACCKQTLAFIDSLQEESDGDDLGVIATRDALAYANDIEDECINIDDVVQAYEDGMIAGAQLHKQQMMKRLKV